jgi:CRISPR-associated protein Cas1
MKRTLYFGNPAHLFCRKEQLCISLLRSGAKDEEDKLIRIPIEDIGMLVLDHTQITLSQTLLSKCMENQVAVVHCDDSHQPVGLSLPLYGHSLHAAKVKAQMEASEPLKKQLWMQTVQAKLLNQARALQVHQSQFPMLDSANFEQYLQQQRQAAVKLLQMVKNVKSGDAENHEGRGASLYWKYWLPQEWGFERDRKGHSPNPLLNYGYAILRALMARQIVSSGLLPVLGIFHRNQYNPFALADDLMEPYRPYVDLLVRNLIQQGLPVNELNKEVKEKLLRIPEIKVQIKNEQAQLLTAIQYSCVSLAKCFEGESRRMTYPEIPQES